jgi:hypothetical protein
MARTRVGPTSPQPEPIPDIVDPLEAPLEVNASGIRRITIKWGSEHIQPIQYNGFHVGDLEIVMDVAPNETPDECYARGWAWLERMVETQFELKLQGFMGRVQRAAQKVRTK